MLHKSGDIFTALVKHLETAFNVVDILFRAFMFDTAYGRCAHLKQQPLRLLNPFRREIVQGQ